ncbi:MAG: NAD(P)-dependent oxidoreductase [Candidatus Altiarchaeota archaeon]|nr:NAD(P)-dependent oxidoreductase [Candidatus Altiarchaeota archaeon]
MILVTGGNGRIGRELVKSLLLRGQEVLVLDARIDPRSDRVKQIQSDLTDLEKLDYFMQGVKIVYHLAASIDYKASKKELYKKNVETTKNLINAALKNNVQQFVFMSTTSVYGDSKTSEPFDEQSATKPYSNYGWSKLQCEDLIAKSGIPYTILRSSQVFGPQFEQGYATVLKYLKQGKMKILGKGDNAIPLVQINDLIQALLLVGGNPNAINQLFNVDGGYNKTQMDFLTIASNALGVPLPKDHVNPGLARFLSKFGAKSSLEEYVDKLSRNRPIYIEKIRGIGFQPKVGLETGIKEVVSVFKGRGLI